ncbi:MAG: hypothetical protein GX647_04535 [Clostridiales bacterium]|jgi:hypothetical protein|nr:hypothetical protein [Clostridiales bacterium]
MLLPFLLGSVSRVFFRADDVGAALGMLGRFFRFAPGPDSLPLHAFFELSRKNWNGFAGLAGVAVLLAVEWIEARGSVRARLGRQSTLVRWCAVYACLLAIYLLGNFGAGAATNFFYERF